MAVTEKVCRSIFRQTMNGKPWNHLCILEEGHTKDHRCWHGPGCATWDDTEASGRAPQHPKGHKKATLFARENEHRQ